jgi:WD40 repeat protein
VLRVSICRDIVRPQTIHAHHGGVMAIHATPMVLSNPDVISSSSSSSSISVIVIATGGRDGAVRVWQSATGAMLREFLGHSKQVMSVRLLPLTAGASPANAAPQHDGASAAASQPPAEDAGQPLPCTVVSSADDIRVWDGMSGVCLRVLQPHKHLVSSLLPVEGQARALVSSSWDKSSIVWDTNSWQPKRSVSLHTASITAAASGPGGKIATGTLGGEVAVWDASTGGLLLRAQRTYSAAVNAIGWCNGCLWLGMETDIAVVSITDGSELQRLHGHTEFVTAIATDAPWVFSASRDGTMRVWDAATRACVRVIAAAGVRCVCLVPGSGCMVVGNTQGVAEIWRPEGSVQRY